MNQGKNMTDNSYVFVCDYKGGTHLIEIFSPSIHDAVLMWPAGHPICWSPVVLGKEILESSIVPINGISECYCLHLFDDMLLNVICRLDQ